MGQKNHPKNLVELGHHESPDLLMSSTDLNSLRESLPGEKFGEVHLRNLKYGNQSAFAVPYMSFKHFFSALRTHWMIQGKVLIPGTQTFTTDVQRFLNTAHKGEKVVLDCFLDAARGPLMFDPDALTVIANVLANVYEDSWRDWYDEHPDHSDFAAELELYAKHSQRLTGFGNVLNNASLRMKDWAATLIVPQFQGLTLKGHAKRKYRYIDADSDDEHDEHDDYDDLDDEELSKTSKRLRTTSIKDTELDEIHNRLYEDRTFLLPNDERTSSRTYHASLGAPPSNFYQPSSSLTLDLATSSSHFVTLQKVLPNGHFEEHHLQNLHYKDSCVWTTPDAFYYFHAALSLHMQATGSTAIDHGVVKDFVLTTWNGSPIVTSLLNANLADNLGLETDAGCPIVRLAFIISDVFDSHPGLLSELERKTDFSRADPALKAWVVKSRLLQLSQM